MVESICLPPPSPPLLTSLTGIELHHIRRSRLWTYPLYTAYILYTYSHECYASSGMYF